MKHKLHLNCCATRICLAKWTDCLKCLIPEKQKLSPSVSVSTVEGQRLWKTKQKVLALSGNASANYRTLHWPSSAARSVRKRTFRTKQSEWQPNKREMIMQTHGPAVTSIVLWFTMLSPAFGLIIAFLSAWLFGRLNI